MSHALFRQAAGLVLLATLLAAPAALAHMGPVPVSLKGLAPPDVPGLLDGPNPIIVNREKALVLGKALFWDISVGSDGMACGSCHFHAGADRRVKNQVAPAGAALTGDFEAGRGVNASLRRGDFPLNQVASPLLESAMARESDDVVASAGTFGGTFRRVEWAEYLDDECERQADAVFHVGGVGARRVMQRNAPSVINAVFNHRNFWDGRANNVFNGSSPWGERDPEAGVWVRQANGQVVRERLHLPNSALASQAVAPVVSDVEMSCAGRRFADLGRKLMWRRPLENQSVHWNDSVLGTYAYSTAGKLKPGLRTYYVHLVRQAFHSRYWSSGLRGPFGAPRPADVNEVPLPYSQYEANFSMFFALALQLYQSTLVSDDSPFDRSRRNADGVPIDLSDSAIRGMQAFRVAHCNLCHIGPAFTAAAVETNAAMVKDNPTAFGTETFTISTTRNVVTRTPGIKGTGFVDTGFAATGVARDEWDPGLAGRDPFGRPLSFAEQYLQYLAGNPAGVVDPGVTEVRPCDLQTPIALNLTSTHPLIFTQANGIQPQTQSIDGCRAPLAAHQPTPQAAAAELANPASRKMLTIVDSAFKIPSLRNVELTGPYMHNGGMASLEEVIEFYARGGNFEGRGKQFGMVFPQPELQLDLTTREDLLNFLKSLTDDRVRYERAPFDHPEIAVPHGHVGDQDYVDGGHALADDLAVEEYLRIPAVGAEGRSEPLGAFVDFLGP